MAMARERVSACTSGSICETEDHHSLCVIGGDVYTDTVRFNSLSIKQQAVEVATRLDATFAGEHGSDGLLGLAFPQ